MDSLSTVESDSETDPLSITMRQIFNDYLTLFIIQSKNIREVSNIALKFLHKTLNIRQQVLLEYDLSISTNLHSIGAVYRAVGHFDEALTYYQRLLEAKLKTIPKSHSAVIENYRILKTVC